MATTILLPMAVHSQPITYSPHTILEPDLRSPQDAHSADLDGDGDLDVVVASFGDDTISWYENLTAAPDSAPGSFGAQVVITTAAVGAKAVYSADLDGDGDVDVLSASEDDNKIAWYENLSAAPDSAPGTFSAQKIISTTANGPKSVYAADLDGDNDLDVLSAGGHNADVVWYENLSAAPDSAPGTFAAPDVISTAPFSAVSVRAADLDGDGDMDVLSASISDHTVASYENLSAAPDNAPGTFAAQSIIGTDAKFVQSIDVADFDGDGDIDVVAAANGTRDINFYENLTAAPDTQPGVFAAGRVISTSSIWQTDVHAADVDGDGDMDILCVADFNNTVAWYENLTAAPDSAPGTFAPEAVITESAFGAISVYAGDFDGDGDLDVLAAAEDDHAVAWFPNLGASPDNAPGTFGAQALITTSVRAQGVSGAQLADIDNDGDLDAVSASSMDDKIAWYENLSAAPDNSPGVFATQVVISTAADEASAVHAVDLDGDGDVDLLSASREDDKIAWYENLTAAPDNNAGAFAPQQVISTALNEPLNVHAADLDGDGDMDVLAGAFFGRRIDWYENFAAAPDNAPGTFGTGSVITTDASVAISVYASDLDGDGDLDVLSASWNDDKIAWYENLSASPDNTPGQFGPQIIITAAVNGPLSVFAADLDNDGDMDVISGALSDNYIAWHENLSATPDNAPGTFAPMVVIEDSGAGGDVTAVDLDADGDLDIVATLRTETVWYENLTAAPENTPGSFAAKKTITADFTGVFDVGDMDGDGDLDLFCSGGPDGELGWLEASGLESDCLPNPCENGGSCTATSPGHVCDCTGTGYSGASCDQDVDECSAGSDNCDANAACTNLQGSFSCECVNGYSGDGVNCVELSGCTTAQDCSTSATCSVQAQGCGCSGSSGHAGALPWILGFVLFASRRRSKQ